MRNYLIQSDEAERLMVKIQRTEQEILNYYGIDPNEISESFKSWIIQLYYLARIRESENED